ncbi:MAG: hypothetical protein ACI4KA_06120 [Oscillospiraceae bacterium]
MTVSQIYDYMTEKVIPESVMPQNISVCLRDDDSVIPELDAFTFLNRVRALGIGSAEFLYLLKGCDAPQAAIDKIESNPAMNLQHLIVTLEESGLTSQDYTRMLYTARQMWERTLTMRIEKKPAPLTEEAEQPSEYDEQPLPDVSEEYEPSAEPEQYEEAVSDDESEPADEPEHDDEVEENDAILTARQKAKPQSEAKSDVIPDGAARQQPKKEYVGREGFDGFYDEDKPVNRHSGKIIAGAIGAAVLIGLSAAMSVFGIGTKEEPPVTAYYAENEQEIFTRIHNAYNSGRLGGEAAAAYESCDSVVFGDMLIQKPQGLEQLGVFYLDDRAFSAEPDLITGYEAVGGEAEAVCTIVPPEGAEFIQLIEGEDRLNAVYRGADSVGIMSFDSSGKTLYTAEQCGMLTDVYASDDKISFGTVYTPQFSKTFSVQQTDCYLPGYRIDGAALLLPPQEVILCESQGCSYAVYGCFSLRDGSLLKSAAALGDPMFSGAEEFFAAMKTESGAVLISKHSKTYEPVTMPTGELIACNVADTFTAEFEEASLTDSTLDIARFQAMTATAEKSENGTAVYLRGIDFQTVAVIQNLGGEVKSLDMRGGFLYIIGDSGVLMAVDITQESPVVPELRAASGIVSGNRALCAATSDSLISLTLYTNGENGVSETSSASRVVTLAQGSEIQLCSLNAMYIGTDRYGAAYRYFDGVSRVSEFTVFGKTKATTTLFDEGEYTCAAELDGELLLIKSE